MEQEINPASLSKAKCRKNLSDNFVRGQEYNFRQVNFPREPAKSLFRVYYGDVNGEFTMYSPQVFHEYFNPGYKNTVMSF